MISYICMPFYDRKSVIFLFRFVWKKQPKLVAPCFQRYIRIKEISLNFLFAIFRIIFSLNVGQIQRLFLWFKEIFFESSRKVQKKVIFHDFDLNFLSDFIFKSSYLKWFLKTEWDCTNNEWNCLTWVVYS